MEASGDIAKAFPEAYEHVIPVLGLYPGTDNTVELRLSDGRRKEIIITTGPLDSAVKLPESIDTTAAYMDGNVMFVIPAMGALPAAYDYRGDCRWYCTENITFAIKELQNGRFFHRFPPPSGETVLYDGAVGNGPDRKKSMRNTVFPAAITTTSLRWRMGTSLY